MDTHYLVSAVCLDGVPPISALANVRGAGMDASRVGVLNDETRAVAGVGWETAQFSLRRLQGDFAKVFAAEPALAEQLTANDAFADLVSFLDLTNAELLGDHVTVDPRRFGKAGVAAVKGDFEPEHCSLKALDGRSSVYMRDAPQERAIMLTVPLVAIALCAYATYSFYLVMRGGLVQLGQQLENLAAGQLADPPQHCGRDEIALSLAALARAMNELSGALGKVHRRAQSVCLTSGRIAADNRKLSGRT